ncbi:type II toxin-antitoxin system PemK/MazF family toxin [Alkalibacterium sp. s-m-22]
MNNYDIVTVYVAFSKGDGGKRRPILVLDFDREGIEFYSLTSKFAKKSKRIQKQYYKIEDWKEAGLVIPSWIDIGKRIWLPLNEVDKISKVGQLTLRDKEKLADFLENYFS